jgi:hypothetical protein
LSEPTARTAVWFSAASIFTSAFLLFSLEPLIAKQILPWFGGTAAVWSTCLVFYQLALLAGYFYARVLTRYFAARVQAAMHVALLGASLLLLPVGPGLRWAHASMQHPVLAILGMLAATAGLPFALLSATSPLLQQWLTRQRYDAPYVLFALSNTASLAALLAYLFIVEPSWDIERQRTLWSFLYFGFAVLCGVSAWSARTSAIEPRIRIEVSITRRGLWFALSACGSMLLLAITNHITQNVAAVPLLWVVPLALYLLTFMLSFARRRFYNRKIWLRVLAMALGFVGYAIYDIQAVEAIQISLPIFLFGLFAGCLFCHAELSALRPEPESLTAFYLTIAAGGAAGAIFVGLLAPELFNGIYELPFALVFLAALVFAVTWSERSWPVRLLWTGVTAAMIAVLAANVEGFRHHSLVLERSFYGSLRVVQSPIISERQTRTLFHGTIKHGEEFLWPALRNRPTTYYGPDSGIGILLRECYRGPKRVGIVGLGSGTIAAFGQTGDTFRFYEINQQVVNIAEGLFYFLRQSPARVEIAVGDGRLLLQRDAGAPFDVLALDAFSGDAIPVHLLTSEAFSMYTHHLKSGGTLAFHVSNQYLDLAVIVRQLAERAGFQAVLVRNHEDSDALVEAADWVLVTNNAAVLENPSVRVHGVSIAARTGLRPWTDSYNNLLEILKLPQMR